MTFNWNVTSNFFNQIQDYLDNTFVHVSFTALAGVILITANVGFLIYHCFMYKVLFTNDKESFKSYLKPLG